MRYQGNVHVVPAGDQWKVEVEGRGTTDTYTTQEQATRAAGKISRRNESELLVHSQDGQIREKDSHGHDPRNIPG